MMDGRTRFVATAAHKLTACATFVIRQFVLNEVTVYSPVGFDRLSPQGSIRLLNETLAPSNAISVILCKLAHWRIILPINCHELLAHSFL